MSWTCPKCERRFGAAGRSHMCSPGITVDRFLADAPDFVPPIWQRIHDHLTEIDRLDGGDLVVDPLNGKVLFKNGPTFCIVTPMKRWVAVGFSLRRRLETERLSREVADGGSRFYHVVNVAEPDEVDDELLEWLTEAYHHGDPDAADAYRGAESAPSGDPMIPDDIDVDINPAPWRGR